MGKEKRRKEPPHFNTSFGSPYSLNTRAFACVYPYGPDIQRTGVLGVAPRIRAGHRVKGLGRRAARSIGSAALAVAMPVRSRLNIYLDS